MDIHAGQWRDEFNRVDFSWPSMMIVLLGTEVLIHKRTLALGHRVVPLQLHRLIHIDTRGDQPPLLVVQA